MPQPTKTFNFANRQPNSQNTNPNPNQVQNLTHQTSNIQSQDSPQNPPTGQNFHNSNQTISSTNLPGFEEGFNNNENQVDKNYEIEIEQASQPDITNTSPSYNQEPNQTDPNQFQNNPQGSQNQNLTSPEQNIDQSPTLNDSMPDWQQKYPVYQNTVVDTKNQSKDTDPKESKKEDSKKDLKTNKNNESKSLLPAFNLFLLIILIAIIAALGVFGYQEIDTLKANQGLTENINALQKIEELERENIDQQANIQELQNKIDEIDTKLKDLLNFQAEMESQIFELDTTTETNINKTITFVDELLQAEEEETAIFEDLSTFKENLQLLKSSSNQAEFDSILESLKNLSNNLSSLLEAEEDTSVTEQSLTELNNILNDIR